MLKLSGLWVNKDKNGKSYMVGYLGNQRVLIMKNDFKELDKHPDYNLYIAEAPQKQGAEGTDEIMEATNFVEENLVPV